MKNLELELVDALFNAVTPAKGVTEEDFRNDCVRLVKACIDCDNVHIIHNFINEKKNKKK